MSSEKSVTVQGAFPCGNPKRYKSRDVIRMPQSGLQGRKRKIGQDGDDDVETESEKHIHSLLTEQIKTDVTLTDQFSRHRSFTPATSHAPGVEKLVGVTAYGDYKQVNDLDAKIDYLRHCGLDDEEITLKLREEMKLETSAGSGGYGTDPQAKKAKIEEINRKIQEKQKSLEAPDSFKGSLVLSRREMDLEKSIAQKQGKDMLLPGAIVKQKTFNVGHPDDPINHLPDILHGMDKKMEREPRRERRRRRKIERRERYYAKFINEDASKDKHSADSGDDVSDSSDTSPLIDSASSPPPLPSASSESNLTKCQPASNTNDNLVQSPAPDESDSSTSIQTDPPPYVPTKKELGITGPVTLLSREEILNNRLSLEEIKGMEKFRNYSEGEPSKTVYVKNLPNRTTEEDLMAIFGSFQMEDKPKLVYKLLSGRMKGQAFITFPDEGTATEAIRLVNGYKLHERPIILAYGKKQ